MGKSNDIVFSWYRKHLHEYRFERVLVLGAPTFDAFTSTIDSDDFGFYDLCSIEYPWNINDDIWNFKYDQYDLIVCTRCPYFAKDANAFLEKCNKHLRKNGIIFLDWGLGDHWRQEPYKVGWIVDDHHEKVIYGEKVSPLYSCAWLKIFEVNAAAIDFRKNIRKFSYYDNEKKLTQIIEEEVPSILDLYNLPNNLELKDYNLLSLWPDAPQLYILTIFEKKN